ncbi:uracil-DNA glycosylase family protein [Euzebya tangerina]|uniref:uracil-DNA glycosylase family protein n=1 Tax=Euzebya tangerina TaxID=591198 RepID=UPI000E321CB8|nr:uracil-DNA glycosylase family protein [Euzebya tangerina]
MEATYSQYWEGRGQPWEYDPGPARNRRWPRLFAQTPNYRGLGKAVLGREKFRWHFGPMHYRGRLTDDDVRVLIIGQEGAQDESLSGRSFTGGTGARMQYLLNHIGITRSYLFLNTFLYPIFGQYSEPGIRALGQDPASPIVQQRTAILDYVLARNQVHLVIAVGTAAEETAVSWLEHHGGHGRPSRLHEADGTVLGPITRLLGVIHPGAAAAGSARAVITDFTRALGQIEQWREIDSTWLPPDPDGQPRPASTYRYRSAPIPFRDLPLGTTWRLGRGGTSSNRKDGQRSIQLFSADGTYNNRGQQVSYPFGAGGGDDEGYRDDPGDVPYEPAVGNYGDYDRGPGSRFARLFMGGEPGHPWPDFTALGATAHPSLGYGAVHRGRPRGAKVVVLADQHGHDDLFSGRALSGDAGQHLQPFLEAMGIDRSYLILRVLPVDTDDLRAAAIRAIIDDDRVRAIYHLILAEVSTVSPDLGAILAVGPASGRLIDHVAPAGVPVVSMKAYGQRNWLASWHGTLAAIESLGTATDAPASFRYDGRRGQIPRWDLPYGTPRWRGTCGDRAARGRQDGSPSPDYYKLLLPRWVDQLDPEPLSPAERMAADRLRTVS